MMIAVISFSNELPAFGFMYHILLLRHSIIEILKTVGQRVRTKITDTNKKKKILNVN